MRNVLLGVFLALLAACTDHPVRIDCDQHLEAINPPHPVAKPEAAAKSP
jgi:type IV pilus biogenesis protein CpaD/CtpE